MTSRAQIAERHAFESADSAAFAVAADAWEEEGRTGIAGRMRVNAELVDILSRHRLATPALIIELGHVRHVCRIVMDLDVRRLTTALKRERREVELRSRLLRVSHLAVFAPAAGDLIDWYTARARARVTEAESRRRTAEDVTEATGVTEAASRRRAAEEVRK